MDKTVSLALIAAGILLLIFGIRESNSFSSDISRFFNNAPTDKAMWMMVAGGVTTLIGLTGVLRRSRS